MSAVHANDALADIPTMQEGRAALARGNASEAVELFYAISQAKPADCESRYWLYSALVASGHLEIAGPTLDDARNLHAVTVIRSVGGDMERFRTDPAYCGALGMQLYQAKLMGPATLAFGKALDLDNPDQTFMLSYGLSMQHQGRLEGAMEVFRLAAETFASPIIHEFMLCPVFIAQFSLAQMADEARKWGELYARPAASKPVAFANSRDIDRPLRIGYIGPTFTRNQVTQFLLPVIEAHDPMAVDVHLYCADPETEGPLPATCKLRRIGKLPSEDVAAMIRDDQIDILVDIWGHTAGSCLPVFALRPAPIQVAWINFLQSTGLPCMDYVFHCDGMAVPGTEAFFTEKIWSLGELMSPSRPASDRPDPIPTPALKNGYVTFGSFNNPAKLNEKTVAAWSRILRERPDSKLILKYSYFIDPVLQRVTQARFAGYGANPAQLEFRGESRGLDYLREFQDIDLALDPSPAIGGATTHDALGNGVPVLSNMGDNYYARSGACTVLPLGIPELVADDWDDYVQRALDLTADFEALDQLRSRIRPAFEASSYRDEAGFTRILEGAYREMFARWATTA
jgi:protein O-GlcNAc transferase